MELADFWNAALTVGVMFGGFMLNRVTAILDKLQDADNKLATDLHEIRTSYVPKSEFYQHGQRLEMRLESYMALQMESNKTLFAKLDVITDRLSEKVSRAECVSMMKDRRMDMRVDQ